MIEEDGVHDTLESNTDILQAIGHQGIAVHPICRAWGKNMFFILGIHLNLAIPKEVIPEKYLLKTVGTSYH